MVRREIKWMCRYPPLSNQDQYPKSFSNKRISSNHGGMDAVKTRVLLDMRSGVVEQDLIN